MANTILNFHFDYWHSSQTLWKIKIRVAPFWKNWSFQTFPQLHSKCVHRSGTNLLSQKDDRASSRNIIISISILVIFTIFTSSSKGPTSCPKRTTLHRTRSRNIIVSISTLVCNLHHNGIIIIKGTDLLSQKDDPAYGSVSQASFASSRADPRHWHSHSCWKIFFCWISNNSKVGSQLR